MTPQLEQKLRDLEQQKSGQYEKRTRHLDDNGKPLFINRLILEDSPYLLQHAHNPVNWFSWGSEAFAVAAKEDKPIFLSIGYSTCHWCHVMEVESFDNDEIAGLLNQDFVSIKLDREQFPDIDDYYMTGVQMVSGQGGWPMSNFLLPDGRPFYGATYFPPAQFADLLNRIKEIWTHKRSELEQSAERIAQGIQQVLQGRQEVRELDMEKVTAAADRMLEREDTRKGGLAGAPKFPQEPLLFYFLDGVLRNRDTGKMAFLERALNGMACGGIFDQVGGGFHRYSTDADWLVPHFEKMLYNQSQLVLLYLGAWRLTGNRFYLRILRQTLDYVLRDMQQPNGGFYSATDADSEDQEGLFFIWSLEELNEILEPEELNLVTRLYGPTEHGNFEGANILALIKPLGESLQNEPFFQFEARLDSVLEKLRHVREQRIPPLRDDKLIVAWSAAMASSLAWVGWELDEPRYLEAAERAIEFVWQYNYAGQQNLRRICLNGAVSIPAQLEDYANLCEALITLFDVTRKPDYLVRAALVMEDAVSFFWNDESAGFYLSIEHEQGPDLARSQSATDGAITSSYAMAVQCLALLAERSALLEGVEPPDQNSYETRLQQAVKAVSAEMDEFPPSHVSFIRAIRHHLDGSQRSIRYGAQGRLRVSVSRISDLEENDSSSSAQLSLMLSPMPGFHVTIEVTADTERLPLTVQTAPDESHWEVESIDIVKEQTSAQSTGVEESNKDLLVNALLHRTAAPADALSESIGLQIQVQVCSDEVCLAPELIKFRC